MEQANALWNIVDRLHTRGIEADLASIVKESNLLGLKISLDELREFGIYENALVQPPFISTFVATYLKELKRPVGTILDPFAGIGTFFRAARSGTSSE